MFINHQVCLLLCCLGYSVQQNRRRHQIFLQQLQVANLQRVFPSVFPSAPARTQQHVTMFDSPQQSVYRSAAGPRCASEQETVCENDIEYNDNIVSKFSTILRGIGPQQSALLNYLVPQIIEDSHSFLGANAAADATATRLYPWEEQPSCLAQETIIYPKRGKTKQDDWAFILNQGSFLQGIRVEKCISESQPCAQIPSGLGISTACRQKYIYRKLLVMDSSGSNIIPESILVPSCCVCYVRRSYSVRSGISAANCSAPFN